jgi:hypothetical protein
MLPTTLPPSFKSLATAPTGRVKMLNRKSTNFLSASAKSTRCPFLSMKSFRLTFFAAMLGAGVNDYKSSNGLFSMASYDFHYNFQINITKFSN